MKFKGYFLDLVGTIVKGKSFEPYEGVQSVFNEIARNHKTLIITNNTTHHPETIEKTLREKDFNTDGVTILTPLTVLKKFLNEFSKKECFVVGNEVLVETVESLGFEITKKEDAPLVVVGLDTQFNYEKIRKASSAILNGAELWGLHRNRLYLKAGGELYPSVGATIAFLEYATGKTARIFGKPELDFYRTGLSIVGLAPEEVVVIGDDPFSEVEPPKRLGMHAIFLLGGKYKDRSILENIPEEFQPDSVLNKFVQLDL